MTHQVCTASRHRTKRCRRPSTRLREEANFHAGIAGHQRGFLPTSRRFVQPTSSDASAQGPGQVMSASPNANSSGHGHGHVHAQAQPENPHAPTTIMPGQDLPIIPGAIATNLETRDKLRR
ncbi:hypothetical protein B2J93_8592 [Marssonina coronariae]|uniref:Uncharacterized protein n=1 Tax=Diplocarpon coronariae TaxID=2795749 RepID=A0A218Z2R2_9HELO|nr:hypothetical protein B2J93_8592 [Marssonina coronariae]